MRIIILSILFILLNCLIFSSSFGMPISHVTIGVDGYTPNEVIAGALKKNFVERQNVNGSGDQLYFIHNNFVSGCVEIPDDDITIVWYAEYDIDFSRVKNLKNCTDTIRNEINKKLVQHELIKNFNILSFNKNILENTLNIGRYIMKKTKTPDGVKLVNFHVLSVKYNGEAL